MEKNTVVEKKEKPSVVKTVGVIETWNINAYSGGQMVNRLKPDGTIMYDGSGKPMRERSPVIFIGSAKVDCSKENDKGLIAARKAFDLDALGDQNRQRKTDTRNNIASGRSALAGVKDLQKAQPELVDMMVQAEKNRVAGIVDKELLAKIQAHFTPNVK